MLKKAELQLKVVKESCNHTQEVYDKMKGQLDAQPKDDGTLLMKREELQRDVDLAKQAYTQQVPLLIRNNTSKHKYQINKNI